MKENLKAPVMAGDKAGEAQYYLNGKKVGSVAILAANDVEKAGFLDYLFRCLEALALKNTAAEGSPGCNG